MNRSSDSADSACVDFGVYVHWPFCSSKCPYCDFNSHVRREAPDQDSFVEAYIKEIRHMGSLSPGRTVTSLFFGGGTPSLMEPRSVERIIEAVASQWGIADDAEITLEANPSSSDAGRFGFYRCAGVNRLSLGVQSFDDSRLRFLGRLHDSREAIEAIALARECFPRISFDLIYALPDQTPSQWRSELERAISFSADHLSLYQLTVEPGTAFFDLHARGKLRVPDEDLAADLYELTQEATSSFGLPAYEVSNHARAGSECRHNLTYWRGFDYAGVGPGAHGRLSIDGRRVATATLRNPEAWRDSAIRRGHGIEFFNPLSAREAELESLLMGLRAREGIRDASGLDSARLERDGFLERKNGSLRATPRGFAVLDAIIRELSSPTQAPPPPKAAQSPAFRLAKLAE